MTIQHIRIDSILTDTSRFSLRDYVFEEDSDDSISARSFEKTGIITPVTLYKGGSRMYHLIDGRKRMGYARRNRMRTLASIVLPESTPGVDIVALILCDRRRVIEASVMNRLQFIDFAFSAGAWESWVIDLLCPAFGFKPHGAFLDDCERAVQLPAGIRRFCHEKKFSMKQVLNLTHFPGDILLQLAAWISELHMTASTMDEIASNLRDCLKAGDTGLDDFLREPDVRAIMGLSLSPQEKTGRLRRLLYERRFPVLSETNARIHGVVERLDLPPEVTVDWDRTLEHRKVDVTLSLSDRRQWDDILGALSSQDVRDAVSKILEDL